MLNYLRELLRSGSTFTVSPSTGRSERLAVVAVDEVGVVLWDRNGDEIAVPWAECSVFVIEVTDDRRAHPWPVLA